jgi:2,4-dienoyl-CoA reductase-like NADH-dependent reductase (Old Yellow Enzyme family)
MSQLLSELKLRSVTFRNRLWVSPTCQYSSIDGLPTDWHLVHLGSRAVGGAGLVVVEATAVSPEGRISPGDSGIWSDAHGEAFKRITSFIKEQGSVAGVQLAHAGRKASTFEPWNGSGKVDIADGGWETVAPSPVKFDDTFPMPREMNEGDMQKVIADFVTAAKRSVDAGFEVIEIHAAHGYLLHEFLSPLSNRRTDEYGGDLENRMRFPLAVASAVREIVPGDLPVFARISATDWAEEGWNLEESIEFCKRLAAIGIDLIDVSSGGLVPDAKITVGPGYQVPFANAIRKQANIKTAAVGMITEPRQAEEILQSGEADAIFVAREFLRDPYMPFRAAKELGGEVQVPKQYGRAIDLRKAKGVA